MASPIKAKTPPKAPKKKVPAGELALLLLASVAVGVLVALRVTGVPVFRPEPEETQAVAGKSPEPASPMLPEMQTVQPLAPVPAPKEAPPEDKKRWKTEQKARERQLASYQRDARKALDRSETPKALELLQAARKLDPLNPKTAELMGEASYQKEEWEARKRSEVAAQKAAQEQPDRASTPAAGPDPWEDEAPASKSPAEPWEQEYTVQPEDVLQITVFEEPDLTTKARVSRSGEIVFPMLGAVPVSGLTVSQVQERLTDLLGSDYLVHPQVQVFVDKPRNVLVTGEVRKPGSYPLSTERSSTVMEMIALAGGFTEDADLDGTRIIRRQNGQKRTIRVRISDIIQRGDREKDEPVRAEDIIFVPESFF